MRKLLCAEEPCYSSDDFGKKKKKTDLGFGGMTKACRCIMS